MDACKSPPRKPLVPEQEAANAQPWYVVHCKPKSERMAQEHLTRQGFLCYLPMLKVYAPKSTARTTSLVRQEVMFPRYLFCQPTSPEQSIAPIRSTQGVLTLVKFGLQPAVVSGDIVTQIKAIEQSQQAKEPAQLSGLTAGSVILVVDGPLASLEGIVNSVADTRVTILFELLGKPLTMSLELAQVRSVP